MLAKITAKIKSASKNPGVYIFYKNKIPLYVGKASNLKNRLQNYLKIIDLKTKALHQEADKLKLIKLNSNIEALITESKLIKELNPKYNILWRDDKNYFYVAITKEKFPRLFATHQTINPSMEYLGPFTEGQPLKAVLRLLRRFFPYCAHKPHLRFCLDSQINNCPGYCCNKQTAATKQQIAGYKKNIAKIKNILSGRDKKFVKKLKDPYELLVLEKIWAHEPYLKQNKQQITDSKINFTDYSLIECYDNSHFAGKEAVGAMTAWKKENGRWLAGKNNWRKFRIRGRYTENDPRMIKEIVSRRLNHPEWPYPDLIIIDGGLTQFNAAKAALRQQQTTNNKKLQIISFAKPQQLVFGLGKNPVPIYNLPSEFQRLIKMAIQSTHNYAVRYHRKIREKVL